MGGQRFSCTACGKCCYGLLPLTIDEAMAHAGTFPLAISITPVKPNARGQSVAKEIGASLAISKKASLFLIVTPVSFIPLSLPCPELASDNKCSIHEDKPLRCRTMPFFPYNDESHQAGMLVPRKGWLCATGDDAPLVYEEQKILDRGDFDNELNALKKQAPELHRYVGLLLQHSPGHLARVMKAAQTPVAGRVIISFLSLLRYNKQYDLPGFAAQQYPVLQDWEHKTAHNVTQKEFHTYYRESRNELERYLP
jgi:Fe-S-cluster containining protein